MLTRIQGTFHFRRKVPPALRRTIGQGEFWASLGTTCRTTAQARAGLLYAVSEKAFMAAKDLDRLAQETATLEAATLDEQERTLALAERAMAKQKATADLRALVATIKQKQHLIDVTESHLAAVKSLPPQIEHFGGRLAEARRPDPTVAAAIAALAQMPQAIAALGAAASSKAAAPVPQPVGPKFSACTEEFLEGKSYYSEQTRHQARATFRLWLELMGDRNVDSITGKDAVDFQVAIRNLPSSHGKSRNGEVAKLAIERANSTNARRITEKTVKRHISALSQYWQFLKRNEYVSKNIFEGMKFPGAKSKKTARNDWSNDDLKKLIDSTWTSRHVDITTARWLIYIAMFTGMRLEEIARLRPEDFDLVEDTHLILIQEQPGWSPKSEAGERAVPLHPRLIELGLLDLLAAQTKDRRARLLHKLRPGGPDGKLGYTFSREFSKHKSRIGIGNKTVFHSFRHSVSTILRNAPASIRSEWIDAVLGHEGGQKSQGATTYLKRIGVHNLHATISALEYPAAIDGMLRGA